MIENILQKHVVIGFNGLEFEGFIVEDDPDYFKMIEIDNSVIFLNKKSILYIRINSRSEDTPIEPSAPPKKFPAILVRQKDAADDTANSSTKPAESYSMTLDGPYQYPSFIKKEEK